ncbi:MAG: TolC family protein [Bacteroidetes bacterium]|nr:TolC family protein [Bacteroidota bacterium]
MKKIALILLITLPASLIAQEKWSLRRCVEYAMQNNISVQQADVQARIAALQVKQAQLNQYPNLNFNTNLSLQFGRSIDPTSNQFTTSKFFSQNYGINGGIQILNWGKLKNTVSFSRFNAQAALEDMKKAANDIALNVANFYLQVLLSNEQIQVSEIQINQTQAQYDFTKKKVDAGALPELNLAEIESQLATDSSNLITAKAAYTQNILSLKGLLNIDAALPFDIETPPVESIPLETFGALQPDVVYQLAMMNQPEQKAFALRIQGAETNIKINKSSMYPSLSGFYGLGSAYNNQAIRVIGSQMINVPIGNVNVGGTNYDVYPNSPYVVNTYGKAPYFNQLNNNFNQNIGLTLSIPIFQNGNARMNYERSKLDLSNMQLQKLQADQTLKTNIYTAYANAVSSFEKYMVGTKQVEAAQKTYDFAQKRYEVGLLTTFELLTDQNNLLLAKLQQMTSHYDYIFKMKVLEYYKGEGLKL